MKSPKMVKVKPRFQLLSKEAQKDLLKYEYAVICLMVLIAATSILWSVSIHILSGDFHHGFLGAKLVFRPRDFSEMDVKAKAIFDEDLNKILNGTYANALNAEHNKITSEMLIMEQHAEEKIPAVKTKVPKISHLFRTNSKQYVPETESEHEPADDNTTELPKIKFNITHDRLFLETMTIDVHQTRWRQNAAVQFVYSFPFLSEIISIIWTAMCLIFQSGVRKYWGLPKPWRIVVPSIFVFTMLSLSTLIYTLLANKYLGNFCAELRAELTKPDALSCGQAISVLRPAIVRHGLGHDVYLNIFRFSYILSLVLWLLALILMTLRFIFAIDFQLVDVQTSSNYNLNQLEDIRRRNKKNEFSEVLLNSPQHQMQYLRVGDERQKSEEDFQSAKSQLSEVATPLLEGVQLQQRQQKMVL